VECVGRYIVACPLRNTNDNFVCAFGGVYGPNDDRDWRELWDELASVLGEILMWFDFRVRGPMLPTFVQQ
jgi:hypothetical protein